MHTIWKKTVYVHMSQVHTAILVLQNYFINLLDLHFWSLLYILLFLHPRQYGASIELCSMNVALYCIAVQG